MSDTTHDETEEDLAVDVTILGRHNAQLRQVMIGGEPTMRALVSIEHDEERGTVLSILAGGARPEGVTTDVYAGAIIELLELAGLGLAEAVATGKLDDGEASA